MVVALCCLGLVVAACALGVWSFSAPIGLRVNDSSVSEAPSGALGSPSKSYAITAAICAYPLFMRSVCRLKIACVALLGAFAFALTAAVCARVAASTEPQELLFAKGEFPCRSVESSLGNVCVIMSVVEAHISKSKLKETAKRKLLS